MAKIKMQEENCNIIHERMKLGSQTMLDNLTNVSMAVRDSIGSIWEGDSAYEFEREFQALKQEMQEQIDELQQLTARFGKTIQEYKNVDAKLG